MENTILNTLNVNILLVGHREKPWECIKFIVTINGEDFDYHIGMGHAKCIVEGVNDGTYISPTKIKKFKADGYTLPVDVPTKKVNIVGGEKIFQIRHLVMPPKIEEVLNCLFLDSCAIDYSFEDWANEFGYSYDSIKAKETYEECIKNYRKLKKALGPKFDEVKNTIELMEL